MNNHGYTLIELMIGVFAIFVFLIIIIGGVAGYVLAQPRHQTVILH